VEQQTQQGRMERNNSRLSRLAWKSRLLAMTLRRQTQQAKGQAQVTS
jgi:hypothetical protein